MKGSEVVKRKRSLFFLVVLVAFSFPQHEEAQEIGATDIGIGFAETTYQALKEPPIENVLPMTNIKTIPNYRYRTTRDNSLPQTGDQASHTLQIWGILCLMCFFWLFLIHQLTEGEDYE